MPDVERRGLKSLFEALGGKYDYGVLRCVAAAWAGGAGRAL